MHKFIQILFLIFAIVILLQAYIIMSTNKTEHQQYNMILKQPDFEIRFYPPSAIASIQSSAKTYKELSGPGIRKLASYIFGNNETSSKIAMTTPVHMDFGERGSSMSFVLPSAIAETILPKPNDQAITISQTAAEYVAAITFGGFASDNDILK